MEREREHQAQRPMGDESGDSGDDHGALNEMRADGVRRQDETDRLIANALSGNSEQFLRGSRQRGGQ